MLAGACSSINGCIVQTTSYRHMHTQTTETLYKTPIPLYNAMTKFILCSKLLQTDASWTITWTICTRDLNYQHAQAISMTKLYFVSLLATHLMEYCPISCIFLFYLFYFTFCILWTTGPSPWSANVMQTNVCIEVPYIYLQKCVPCGLR